jgi:hypothetical protein
VGSYRILEPVFVGNPSVYKGMARMRKIELSNQKKSLDFGTFLRLRKAVLNGRMDINLVILPVRKLLLDDPAVRKKLKERERKAKQ